MTTDWTIREERPQDREPIRQVTKAAFTDHPHSEGAEPDIVDRLRADGDMVLSLVAMGADNRLVGHCAFSDARLSTGEGGWYTLGPLSVAPDMQRQGVGTRLVRLGLARLQERGARGVVVLGDPAYYARFGFLPDTPITLEGPLAKYLQVVAFTRDIPEASVTFAPAFDLVRTKD